jgi:hypothetical protein
MAYILENKKWQTANKKCMAFIKNTIEQTIVGSIAECDSVGEYLEKIKNQFTGSSKIHWRWTWHKRAHPQGEQHGS